MERQTALLGRVSAEKLFAPAASGRRPGPARGVRCAAQVVSNGTNTYTGAGISGPATGSHFLHIDDYSKEELWEMLQTSIKVKEQLRSDTAGSYKPFAGKTMAMIFTKPSMRTRISFETVCCHLLMTAET